MRAHAHTGAVTACIALADSSMRSRVRIGMISSLQDACFYWIVNHIGAFSAAALALLPSRVRLRLLPFVPAIDLWRLSRSPAFCRGLVLEEEWRRRVATHITAWNAPQELEFISDGEETTFMVSYLRYTLRLILSSSGKELSLRLQRKPSNHVESFEAYYERLLMFFHLRRAKLNYCLDDPALLSRQGYIHLLFYGVCIEKGPHSRFLKYTVYGFDSQEKYLFPHHYAVDMTPSTPPPPNVAT